MRAVNNAVKEWTMTNGCDYEVELDDEEVEGIAWVGEVLAAIRDKGEDHKSYRKAAACSRALNKIRQHCSEMHDVAHVLEHQKTCIGTELAQIRMQIQPWGKA